jgi:hypothetical protein
MPDDGGVKMGEEAERHQGGSSVRSRRDAARADGAALGEALIAGEDQAPRVAWERFAPLVRCILKSTPGPAHEVRLCRLLENLNAEDRTIFVLRLVDGLTLTAVASAIGVSLPTVKHRLAPTRRRVSVLVSRDPYLTAYLSNWSAAVPNQGGRVVPMIGAGSASA